MKTLDKDFNELTDSELPVLAYFSATWCGPCRLFKPRVQSATSDRTDIVAVAIDVDENQELAENFGVMSVPTIVGIRGGKEVSRIVGARSESEVTTFIDNLIGE